MTIERLLVLRMKSVECPVEKMKSFDYSEEMNLISKSLPVGSLVGLPVGLSIGLPVRLQVQQLAPPPDFVPWNFRPVVRLANYLFRQQNSGQKLIP